MTTTRPADAELLADEALYCSHGDTVHYVEPPKIFERCDGSWMFDARGVAYLDLQMWYSAVNFGYANPRFEDALGPPRQRPRGGAGANTCTRPRCSSRRRSRRTRNASSAGAAACTS